MKKIPIILGSLVLALAGVPLNAAPLGTAFTYQGRLTDGGNPANGRYDLECAAYDAESLGNQIGSVVTNQGVAVSNGLFTVSLDFGANVFTGSARWLAIGVRSNGVAGNYTPLNPRQPLTPAPYALYAPTAGTVTDGAIQISKLGTTGPAPTAGQILGYDGSSLFWQTPGGPNLWSLNSNNDAYYNGGRVGIGTSGPSGKLTVATANDTTPSLITSFDGRHVIFGTASQGVGISYSANTGAGYISTLAPGAAWKDLVLQASTLSVNPSGGATAFSVLNSGSVNVNGLLTAASHVNVSGNLVVGNGAITASGLDEFIVEGTLNPATLLTSTRFVVKQNGNVGIGRATPLSRLDVNGNINYGQLTKLDVEDSFAAYVRAADFNFGHSSRHGSTGRALVDNGSELHLNFASDWANTVIGGNNVSVCTLTIRGGCDLAEPFQMSIEEIPKGAVVVIDEENAGQLKLSRCPYDKHVAGIVSGANGVNPGIALHQEGVIEGGQNVALSGRVYVQADASSSPIKPGDLLTTSDTPGHAMKVRDQTKAQGAIIGKAMSVLYEGKGMVLVLVTLQ